MLPSDVNGSDPKVSTKMHKKKTLLWLDDVRDPAFYDLWVRQYLGDEFYNRPESHQIVWVKSFDQFRKYLQANGVPDVVGFDHDLGGKMTGADAAEFLCNLCVDELIPLPEYFTQSANPVGKANIHSKMDSARKVIESNRVDSAN